MNRCTRVVALSAAGLLAGGAIAGAVVVFSGWYDVSATQPHTSAIYRLLNIALDRSVAVRATAVSVPALDSAEGIRRGFDTFRLHCMQCHGAPGIAPEPFALGLNPPPPPLVSSARERPAAEVFWIIREGIKMTGMPAWRYRLSDAQMWDVVAFMRAMPALSPDEYRQWDESNPLLAPASVPAPVRARAANTETGRLAMQQYLCVTCHTIPGVQGATNHVGPSLAGIASRPFIAGSLSNNPANMQRWLRGPAKVKPGTAMPDVRVTEQDARDMAAFLSTLTDRTD